MFISNSIKEELFITLKSLPQITVQKLQAGRHTNIEIKRVDELLKLGGVQSAIPRVWGYYYFERAGVNFSVVGIDSFDKQYKKSFKNVVNTTDFDTLKDAMIVGEGVKKLLVKTTIKSFLTLFCQMENLKKLKLLQHLKAKLHLNQMILSLCQKI